MEFDCCKIRCGGGYWALVWKFIASQCESHSVGFGLLGSDVAYYTAVCDLASFGYLILVNKKSCVVALDVSYSLEKASYLISKWSCPFWFVGPFHQVPVFLRFSYLWAYYRVRLAWMDCHISCCIVGVCPVFSWFLYWLCMEGFVRWLERLDCFYMVVH